MKILKAATASPLPLPKTVGLLSKFMVPMNRRLAILDQLPYSSTHAI